MKFDSFLTSPRWEILQILAKTPSSPIELAEKLGTTVAYMSQQLKLLDAAGLVIKSKTGATEKGKPRSLYTLSSEMIYFVSLNSELADKKLILFSKTHAPTLKIWMIEDATLHYYFEKVYWKLEDSLGEDDLVYLDSLLPKLIVITDSSKIKTLLSSYVSKFDKKVNYEVVSHAQFKKINSENFLTLFNQNLRDREVKGGSKSL